MLAKDQILQNRYRIIKPLGYGGMGAVYEATDQRFDESIALKEIIFEAADKRQKDFIVKAFEREARTLAKIKHEVIPFVRDYFSESERQFLVMELVEGEDLGGRMENSVATFTIEQVVDWMFQLLDALDYLHNLQPPIIHRDIKPQNLKVNARNRIKLLDFGVARNSDNSSVTLTTHTFVGATLDYSPIEQILRVIAPTFREFLLLSHKEKAEEVLAQDTDARCDIYALGATFYHLLTRTVPVDSTKRTLDLWEGKDDPLANPSDLNPHIPQPVSNCLLRAMAVERNERYESAAEMREALRQASQTLKTDEMPTLRFNSSGNIQFKRNSGSFGELTGESMISKENIQILLMSETPVNITEQSYLEGILHDKKQTLLKKSLTEISNHETASLAASPKPIWLTPVVSGGFLMVAMMIIVIWGGISLSHSSGNKTISNSPTPLPMAPVANIKPTVPTPIPTPVLKETPIARTTPNVEPTAPNKSPTTPAPKVQSRESTQNITPKPARTPIPATVKTPRPSVPKRTTAQNPNCIFTNSCH